jgi:hypothetical protein
MRVRKKPLIVKPSNMWQIVNEAVCKELRPSQKWALIGEAGRRKSQSAEQFVSTYVAKWARMIFGGRWHSGLHKLWVNGKLSVPSLAERIVSEAEGALPPGVVMRITGDPRRVTKEVAMNPGLLLWAEDAAKRQRDTFDGFIEKLLLERFQEANPGGCLRVLSRFEAGELVHRVHIDRGPSGESRQ